MIRKLALLSCLLPAAAAADETEAYVRPYFEARRGPVPLPSSFVQAGTRDALIVGGGLAVDYGLSFSWTLSARYGFDRSQSLQVGGEINRTEEWAQSRHVGAFGLAYAPSDALTPVFQVEAGVAHRTLTDAVTLLDGRREFGYSPASDIVPIGRLSAGLRWMPSDFVALNAAPLVEYADGLTYGAQFSVSLSRYLD